MPLWTSYTKHVDALRDMDDIADRITGKTLDLGRRHYALSLAVGVLEAIFCGHAKIAAVEMGVAKGAGLLDLCRAADFFRKEFGLDIQVFGFDTGSGLPPPADRRDHPEIWRPSQYDMGDPEALRARLPDFGHLIIGNIRDTAESFAGELGERKLAFLSIDVDFYSSTVDCLRLLTFDRDCYMPAVPMYVDDLDGFLTFNEWCGEPAAIAEFNAAHEHRKIQRRDSDFRITRFHVAHILDHPMRTGEQPHRDGWPHVIRPFRNVERMKERRATKLGRNAAMISE